MLSRSSTMAALAIVSGSPGVRPTNRDALRLAHDEREAKRQHELTTRRRRAYAQFQTPLNLLAIDALNAEFVVAGAHRRAPNRTRS